MLERRELEEVDDEALFGSCELQQANVALKRTERGGFGIDSDNWMPGDGS
jgi:hypothetical protein